MGDVFTSFLPDIFLAGVEAWIGFMVFLASGL